MSHRGWLRAAFGHGARGSEELVLATGDMSAAAGGSAIGKAAVEGEELRKHLADGVIADRRRPENNYNSLLRELSSGNYAE